MEMEMDRLDDLVNQLKDKDLDIRVRIQAAEALGQMGDARAVQPLIAAFKDQASEVRRSALRALESIGEPAVEPLIAALKDPDSDVRRKASCVLRKVGDVRAVESLITALEDQRTVVRFHAAEALGRIGDARVTKPLIETLKKDQDKHVRKLATNALRQMGESTMEFLIAALTDKDADVRCRIVYALGEIGDDRAIEPLIAALKDQAEEVRRWSVLALGKFNDKRVIAELERAAKEDGVSVRDAAQKTLEVRHTMKYAKMEKVASGLRFKSPVGLIVETTGNAKHIEINRIYVHEVVVVEGIGLGEKHLLNLDYAEPL
jgi:HEAT repeat protein